MNHLLTSYSLKSQPSTHPSTINTRPTFRLKPLALSLLLLGSLSSPMGWADYTAGGGAGGVDFNSTASRAGGVAGGSGGSYKNFLGCNGLYGGGGGAGDGSSSAGCIDADIVGTGGRGGASASDAGGQGGSVGKSILTGAYIDIYNAVAGDGGVNGKNGGSGGGSSGGGGGAGLIVSSADADMAINVKASIMGGIGGIGGGAGAGGGGGAGLIVSSADANVTIDQNGSVTGGDGGSSSGGGGGGVAMLLANAGTVTNAGTLTGGSGGSGGSGRSGGGGGVALFLQNKGDFINESTGIVIGGTGGNVLAGDGNAGVMANGGTIDNSGTMTGGRAGTVRSDSAGKAGAAILANGTTITNQLGATIKGGDGTIDINASNSTVGAGGAGVVLGEEGESSLTNYGTISAGTGIVGDIGVAIDIQSNNNSVTLADGSVLNGAINIATWATVNKLTLDGTTTNSLDASTITGQSFDSLTKIGTGSWTVGNDLKSGSVLVSAGTLILANDNSYTDGTTINAGATLQLGDGGTTGSVQGDITDNGLLVINRSDDIAYTGVITGTGGLTQMGTGLLTLVADYNYTGTTTINAGATLQLGNGGTTGSIQGSIVNHGQLILDKSSDTTLTGDMTGTGAFTKNGTGVLTLTGVSELPQVNLNAGELTVSGTGAQLTSNIIGAAGTKFNIESNGVFNGTIDPSDVTLSTGQWNMTASSEVNNLINGGTIAFAAAPLIAGTPQTLTVDADYTGNGGTLVMNTVLGDDSSATDKLNVLGSTSGTGRIQVVNQGGTGGQTVNGIQLISVAGASNGTFDLVNGSGAVIPYTPAGLYDYQLVANSTGYALTSSTTAPTPTPSPTPTKAMIRPEVGGYLANQAVAASLFQQSRDDRFAQHITTTHGLDQWGRVQGGHDSYNLADNRLSQSGNRYLLQVGSDVWVNQWAGSSLHLGLMGGAGHSQSTIQANDHSASAKATVRGYALGLYGTWQAQTGLYLDSTLQYSWYQNSVSRALLGDQLYNSQMVMGSVELGYPIGLLMTQTMQWTATPQAQLFYSHTEQADLIDANDTAIGLVNPNRFTTRLGIAFAGSRLTAHSASSISPTVSLNWWHGQGSGIEMDNQTMNQSRPNNRFELKAGVDIALTNGWSLTANLGGQLGASSYRSYFGQLGVQYLF